MITDRQLVLAAQAAYDPAATPYFSGVDGALRAFVTVVDSVNVFAVEGTHDPLGWALDFIAIPEESRAQVQHPTFGFVHAGFYGSAIEMLPALDRVASQGPYALAGHSLGAALALLLGAMMIDAGIPPLKIGAFAPPRVGGDQLVKQLANVPVSAYRFADDPVPEVPFTLPLIPYRQVPLIQIGRAQFARTITDPFAYHAVKNYAADVPLEPGETTCASAA